VIVIYLSRRKYVYITTKGYCKKALAEEVLAPAAECHKVLKEL
jgi:hypothetical protein